MKVTESNEAKVSSPPEQESLKATNIAKDTANEVAKDTADEVAIVHVANAHYKWFVHDHLKPLPECVSTQATKVTETAAGISLEPKTTDIQPAVVTTEVGRSISVQYTDSRRYEMRTILMCDAANSV